MALAGGMAESWFRSAALVVMVVAAAPAWAQVRPEDRAEIVRLAQSRGFAEPAVLPLLEEADRAVQQGLPSAPVVNKIKEGLSKGYPPPRVLPVVRDLIGQMDTARTILGNVPDEAVRTRAMLVLTEALGRGVTRAEVEELRGLLDQGAAPPERLAQGARAWALMKEAGLLRTEALSLVAEAVRQGFRDAELLSLAREAAARREVPATPERPRVERPAVPERPQPQRPEAKRPEVQRPATGR